VPDHPIVSAKGGTVTDPTPPIACRPYALDRTQRPRQQALLAKVRRAAIATRDLPNGLVVTFPADPGLFLELAEWISLEHRCCPFLDFDLEWKGDETVSVRLTGGPGVKEAIAAEMGLGDQGLGG
jgi:hypothetical protein